MNKIILMLGLLLLTSCTVKYADGGCDVGLFASQSDIDYCNEQISKDISIKMTECAGLGGYKFDGKNCAPIGHPNHCVFLEGMEILETTTLPLEYEHITDNYEDENVTITIFCAMDIIKPYNTSCETYDGLEPQYRKLSYYRIRAGYNLLKLDKRLPLCWNRVEDKPKEEPTEHLLNYIKRDNIIITNNFDYGTMPELAFAYIQLVGIKVGELNESQIDCLVGYGKVISEEGDRHIVEYKKDMLIGDNGYPIDCMNKKVRVEIETIEYKEVSWS